MMAHPQLRVRPSLEGKGRPVKATAAGPSVSGASAAKYVLSSSTFSSLRVVAPIFSPTAAKASDSSGSSAGPSSPIADGGSTSVDGSPLSGWAPAAFRSGFRCSSAMEISSWLSTPSAHASMPRSRKVRANSSTYPCTVKTRFGCTSSTKRSRSA